MATLRCFSSSPDPYLKLTSQIQDEFKSIEATVSSALDAKLGWTEELERIVKRVLPGSRLILVGSSTNLFGFKHSDCDLTVVTEDKYASEIDCLRKIESALKQHRRRFDIEPIYSAKVPILKVRDDVSSYEGDISINQENGIRSTYLLKCYASMDPRVRPLALMIKKWAQEVDITDARKHKLSGFSLLILYVYYLQVGCSPPVVPMLQSTYPEHFGFNVPILAIIDHIKTNHEPREIKNFVSPNRQSLGELLVGFYRFYSTFDWSEVISISRPNSYVTNRRPFMRIEDPYEPGGNSARGIYQWFAFSEIKRAFSQAANNLNNDLRLENVL